MIFFLSWKKKRWLFVFLCVFFVHWLSDYTVGVGENICYRVAGGGDQYFSAGAVGERSSSASLKLYIVFIFKNYYSITLLIIVVYL